MFKKYSKKDIFTAIGIVILSTIFVVLHQLLGNAFVQWMWLINGILLVLMFTVIYIRVGMITMKALFALSAELSLVIFIAYTYCGTSLRNLQSDQALQSLLLFGLAFIAYEFVRKLYEGLRDKYKEMRKDLKTSEKVVFVSLALYAVGLFIWQIYLVMSPIVLDLCVFSA